MTLTHQVNLTLCPPEGITLEGCWRLRSDLEKIISIEVPEARLIGGGTKMEKPMEFDLTYQAVEFDAGGVVAAVVHWALMFGYGIYPMGSKLMTDDYEYVDRPGVSTSIVRVGVHPVAE